uniref:Protein kinase domain-containing protein n=1 Tax=Cyclophora tenuis TaxID=216820 RepID=A0A7S1GPG9_CYCTE|mmetsp:Transcript_4484/g.7770  ORF Transcript_4484/g.7770 Transcript_4484/m.7770 type:complete len:510 (+) Transcript_4484:1-1530(+)
MTASEALESDWMTAEAETLTATDLSEAQRRIRKRLPVEKLRAAVKAVIATNKFNSLPTSQEDNSKTTKTTKGSGSGSSSSSSSANSSRTRARVVSRGNSVMAGSTTSALSKPISALTKRSMESIVEIPEEEGSILSSRTGSMLSVQDSASLSHFSNNYDLHEEEITNELPARGLPDRGLPGKSSESSLKSGRYLDSQKFRSVYNMGDLVGTGSYSTVFAAVHKDTRQEYTVKRIDRNFLNVANAIAIQDEIETLLELRGCPNIVSIHEVYEEVDFGFVIMEKMTGGDLLSRISERESYTEADAKKIFCNLLSGIKFCHENQIANRGLQADSLLLVSPHSDTDIKITDFGYAKKVTHPNSLRTQCGTIGYVAPEILSHSPAYDVPCDMWSAGVILYLLLGGYRPFRSNNDDEVMERSRYGRYEFHKKYWSDISQDAKDLIQDMLTVDPKKRITAKKALKSQWLTTADQSLAKYDLSRTQGDFQKEVAQRKFRAVVHTIMATNRLSSLGSL